VETAVAELAEIHETRMQGDVMEMRPVEGGIDIPPGETAVLAPRGLHIMLLELHQPLLEGEALMLTLHFESGEEIALAVPIYDLMMMGM
ncbi:MAG: copper chaperone PCu(A)C, partial [Anaerolineae bacterium]|nr:copper chaperone PCu(A)C [Anaerolineae bacterium]